ncbi:MAG: acetylornithine transaminase [Planctomycetota bacterium]
MGEHVMPTYHRADEVFVAGDGAVLRTAEGREFLDFLGGIAVSALGHAHPVLVEALRDQVGRALHVSNLYHHPLAEPVAAMLAEATGLDTVFFCNSGAEAVETALKIARKHHHLRGEAGRTGFAALCGGFHGRTAGALSVTHKPEYRAPFGPLLEGVTFVQPEDSIGLETALAQRPAALILEPIQGEGGIRALSADFLRLARAACDATGTVLIHDEVQSGCGRTGTFLAAQAAGVQPDLVTLAKPLAAGLPIGVVVARPELRRVLAPGDHGSTFGGGPLACRAALVLLQALRDGLLDDVRARGAQLQRGLTGLAAEFDAITEVRGRGLMLGLQIPNKAAELHGALHARGLLANCTAGDVVRFLPPFVISEAQVATGLDRIHDALTTLSDD